MNKLRSYLLNEDYYNRRILKEEIIPENKTAIVYHLTGKPWKDEEYYPDLVSSRSKTVDVEYANAPDYFFHTSLKELGLGEHAAELERLRSKQKGEEGYSSFLNTPQGKTYWIAKKLFANVYSGGSAFRSGRGAAYGRGLYSCYELNPRIASTYGDVILKFEVDISNFLIFSEDIAKQIHGDNYRLQDQFISIIKRNPLVKSKGIDIEALIEDVSSNFGSIMTNFLSDLTEASEDPGEQENSAYIRDVFKGSKTGTRTAGLAQETLYGFSKLTDSETKLRELVDGVIFFGNSDGPVCVIYRPETSNNYYPVGAGFFNKDGNAVIVDDLERLRGFKGIRLPLKMRAAKMYKQKKGSPANLKLENHNDELSKSLEKFINIELDFSNDPYRLYLKSIVDELEKHLVSQNIVDQVILARLSADPDISPFCDFVEWFVNTTGNILPKMLEPTIKLINLIGPGLEIINSEELVKYHEIFVETAIKLNKSGFNSNGFDSIIKNRYNLKFNEEFIKIISNNISNKVRQEISRLLGVDLGIFVVYTTDGYKDICKFGLNILGLFVDAYVDMDNMKKFIPNKYTFDLDSFNINTDSAQEQAIIEEFKNSPTTKQAIENIADLAETNLEYKIRFFDQFQEFLPNADASKRFILPVDMFTEGFSLWSNHIDICCTLCYTLLDKHGTMQNKIKRKNCLGFEVPTKIIFETNSNLLGIQSDGGYDPSYVEALRTSILNNSTAIDYPGNILSTDYRNFQNLNNSMIDLGLITSEEAFKRIVKDKADNLFVCLDMGYSQEFLNEIKFYISGGNVSI